MIRIAGDASAARESGSEPAVTRRSLGRAHGTELELGARPDDPVELREPATRPRDSSAPRPVRPRARTDERASLALRGLRIPVARLELHRAAIARRAAREALRVAVVEAEAGRCRNGGRQRRSREGGTLILRALRGVPRSGGRRDVLLALQVLPDRVRGQRGRADVLEQLEVLADRVARD